MKYTERHHVIFCVVIATILFSVCYLGSTCQNQIKDAMHGAKYSGAVALMEIDRTVVSGEDAYLKSKEGVAAICKPISDENPNYSDEKLKDACFHKVSDLNIEINKGLRAARSALFVLEDTIDIWDAVDAKTKMSAIGAALSAIDHLMDTLEESGCPLPQEIFDYADYLGLLAETLKDMD